MGWSTELFCNISFNRETFNDKYLVEDRISDLNKMINHCKQELRDLVMITEPQKFLDIQEGSNVMLELNALVRDNFELLEEYYIERYKLELLLDNWKECHDENGLAIEPPEGITWKTAFLDGDFIKTNKHPDCE